MILKTLTIAAVAGLIATVAASNADAAQRAAAPTATQQTEYGSAGGWFAANGAEAVRLLPGGGNHNIGSHGSRGDSHGGNGGSHGGNGGSHGGHR